jgi:TraY domain
MEKQRRGRPVKPAVEGERTPLSLRVSSTVKGLLEAAAQEAGRSLSQEAELRLESSFERDWLLKRLQTWLRKEVSK